MGTVTVHEILPYQAEDTSLVDAAMAAAADIATRDSAASAELQRYLDAREQGPIRLARLLLREDPLADAKAVFSGLESRDYPAFYEQLVSDLTTIDAPE